jgi:hypothetical protein
MESGNIHMQILLELTNMLMKILLHFINGHGQLKATIDFFFISMLTHPDINESG